MIGQGAQPCLLQSKTTGPLTVFLARPAFRRLYDGNMKTASPLLFLDFDDVMNTTGSCSLHKSNEVFTPEAVRSLKRIVAETDCRIVISSTWRIDKWDRLKPVLCANGLDGAADRIIGKTKVFDAAENSTREDEVDAWLFDNKCHARLAALDDDPFLHELRRWQVLTTAEHGLTGELADRAITLLLEGPFFRSQR